MVPLFSKKLPKDTKNLPKDTVPCPWPLVDWIDWQPRSRLCQVKFLLAEAITLLFPGNALLASTHHRTLGPTRLASGDSPIISIDAIRSAMGLYDRRL